MSDRPKIVVSGVNIRKGGTLTVMRDCLSWLSSSVLKERYEIIAIVHDRNLFPYPDISYIEYPDSVKSWFRRLHYEYIEFNKLSKSLENVELWFSMHDTSPKVKARAKMVYCQTAYPFYKFRWHDFLMDYKIPLFSIFTRFVYQYNSSSTDRFIVQQKWFTQGLSQMIRQPLSKFTLFPPHFSNPFRNIHYTSETKNNIPVFFFPSTPDCHKNFESLLEACRILEAKIGRNKFKTIITIRGDENRYAEWLKKRWGDVSSVEFAGFLTKDRLYATYVAADCLIFPSLIESWGLPISEFLPLGKPMILSNLPYAHETAAGADKVAFVNTRDPYEISNAMENLINGNNSLFTNVNQENDSKSDYHMVNDWNELFTSLL